MFLVIKKKTPVSRNSVLEKVETQILPAWWLLIWGTQVEVLGILFPFCVFFFSIFLSYIIHLVHSQPPSWAGQEHSGLVNHLQSTFTGSQSKEKKMYFPTWSHLAEAKHFQGSLADTRAPSKAHSKEQAILLLPFTGLPANSLVSAPSSHAGFQHLNSFHRLRTMPSVNTSLYQEPLLVLLALRMHNLMTWVKTQEQWLLNKDNFPRKRKGLAHI